MRRKWRSQAGFGELIRCHLNTARHDSDGKKLKVGLPKDGCRTPIPSRRKWQGRFQYFRDAAILYSALWMTKGWKSVSIRAQEISRYVEHGYLDYGITDHETGLVEELAPKFMRSANSRTTRQRASMRAGCYACRKNSPVKSVKDLKGKRIATRSRRPHKKISQAESRQGLGGVFLERDQGENAFTNWSMRLSKSRKPRSSLAPINCASWIRLLVSTPQLIVNLARHGKIRGNRQKVARTWRLLLKGALEAETKVGPKR